MPNQNTNLETRFNTALKEIRKGGVKARRNVMGCCRGCTLGTGHVDDNTPFIEHFGGQGNRFMLQGNYAYYVTGGSTPIDKLYFSHDGLVEQGQLTKAGELVVATFERNDIVIDWDRTNTHSVVILMLDSVYHRTPHEQGLIVNDLMAKYDLTAEELLNPNYAIQRANWRVYDKGISPYLFELEYTDEKIDAMASNIAEGKQAVQKQHEYRDEQLRLADEQLAINANHEQEITLLMPNYSEDDVDRVVEWIRLRHPQQRFYGDDLMTLITAEYGNHKGMYNNREEVVNALEASVIWNLPAWVSVDYREALEALSSQYLIAQIGNTYHVWYLSIHIGYEVNA